MTIETRKVTKIFWQGKKEVVALNGVDLVVRTGSFVLVKGPSGCGKSTLLFTLGGMLVPSSGTVTVEGHFLYRMTEQERNGYRATHIGFVFQSYHLLPYLTVLENMLISRQLHNKMVTREKAIELAASLHIDHRLHHKPSGLSAGEKQRAALARAFITQPEILFADEPTGNLDPVNAKEVIDHLVRYHKNGKTVIMVTHGNEADDVADTILSMENGQIIHTTPLNSTS